MLMPRFSIPRTSFADASPEFTRFFVGKGFSKETLATKPADAAKPVVVDPRKRR